MARVKLSQLVGQTFKVRDLPEGSNVYTGIDFDADTNMLTAWRHDLTWASVFNHARNVLWFRPASDNELGMIEAGRKANIESNTR